MAFALSEDQFRCSICLDIFNNPVSIPCGHNFCRGCIKRFWDSRHKLECPLCKEKFQTRPELRTNIDLRDITEKFKGSLRGKPHYKPAPPKKIFTRRRCVQVFCDVCTDSVMRLLAVKSCLVCQASYCEVHLTPHLRDPILMKHRLTDPATFVTSHLCSSHNKPLDMFCKREQIPVCMQCRESNHRHHPVATLEKESKRIKTHLKMYEAEYQQMVKDRLKKLAEIKTSGELRKTNSEQEIQTSIEVVTTVIGVIEKNQASLIEEIEQKQLAAERAADELVDELRREISELQGRQNELQHLEQTDDALHLLQSFPSLTTPLFTKDWSQVSVQSDSCTGTVRRALSKLVDVCQQLEKKLSADEIRKASQYAVDVTLDPVSASGWLRLSSDGKQVSVRLQQKNPPPPDDPLRFDSCVSVLGKQSFSSGKSYWVVQVGDKTDWDLGVAKESINRKGAIIVRPDSGYWAICRRKGGSLSACTGPSVTLHLQEPPQKVGVFLDYSEGMVSFYDADANTHIYTYSGCNFTEPLYPYLNPCLHDNGKNTAPLIVCPVEVGLTEDIDRF